MFHQMKIQLISLPEADTDCMLSNSARERVECLFGPFDLMSLDSNCQSNRVGLHLPHLRPVQLQNLAVSMSSPILFIWVTISTCSRHLSI